MRGDKGWQEEKVVYHLFLQISLVPPTGNCFVFFVFSTFSGPEIVSFALEWSPSLGALTRSF